MVWGEEEVAHNEPIVPPDACQFLFYHSLFYARMQPLTLIYSGYIALTQKHQSLGGLKNMTFHSCPGIISDFSFKNNWLVPENSGWEIKF